MNAPELIVDGVEVRLPGASAPVVDGVTFTLPPGERAALLGPSGCGKTTTLRTLAGFERAAAGRITLGGRVLAGPGIHVPAHRRGIGYVFQDLALFPHLTVADNVGFGVPRTAAGRRAVDELLALVELDGLRGRLPGQLSGGQQQRVALARALAPGPGLLLLDEPFSSLDATLRDAVLAHTRDVIARTGATTLLVTHDRGEAMAFARQLLVMRAGRIEQAGDPGELYRAPRTRFVATALGAANLLVGEAAGRSARTALGAVALEREADGAVELCLRPEALALAPADGADAGTARVRVVTRAFRGASTLYAVEGDGLTVEVLAPGDAPWRPGDTAALIVRGAAAVLAATP